MGRSHAFALGVLVALTVSAGGRWSSKRDADEEAALAGRVRVLESRWGVDPPLVPKGLLERIARLERAYRMQALVELRRTPRGSPVVGGIVTSGASRSRMHPILHEEMPHNGVDIGAAAGTPIHATADGVVKSRFNNRTLGIGVDLDHGRGTFTRYGHMDRTAVAPGDRVVRGDVIGYVGSTGRATGPHVHYEVFYGRRRVDPAVFLPDDFPVASRPGGSMDY